MTWYVLSSTTALPSLRPPKDGFPGRLRTPTIIKDAVENVKDRQGVELDPELFPLDDPSTYELFQRGATEAIFQYESAGMQKHMKSLKPTEFEDLIAMNALYRPGPMEYIPSFVARKHGKEKIIYDLDDCEEYLKETYGITVYQEQVMLLSQKLAYFTKGEADTLRKAMGKKKADLIAMLKPKFIDQGAEKGHDKDKLEKIWKDWEAFASYAFNKSHSTCYAWIAYQTAYLKANYPAEFMAAVLSNNMNDLKKTTQYMDEARRMGIDILYRRERIKIQVRGKPSRSYPFWTRSYAWSREREPYNPSLITEYIRTRRNKSHTHQSSTSRAA